MLHRGNKVLFYIGLNFHKLVSYFNPRGNPMHSLSKFKLLTGVLSFLTVPLVFPQVSYAQCVTTGAITANCNFINDTTGNISLGDISNGVTMTITNDVIIGHTINDDNNNADGIIATNGTGRTVSQTAAIGGINNISTLTLGAGDIWNSSAAMNISTVDLNAGSLNINNNAYISGNIIDDGGVGILNYGADTNGGLFNINGSVDTVRITVTSGELNTNGNNLGTGAALNNININSGARFNINDNVTSLATLTNAGTIYIKSSETLTVNDQTDAAGTFIFNVDSSTDYGDIIIPGGNDVDITSATIQVDVGIGNISNSNELLIGDGGAQVNAGAGQATQTVSDDSYRWNFQVADGSQAEITTGGADNTQLYLIVNEANTISDSSLTLNNEKAGNTINSISNTLNGQLQNIVGNMNGAKTQQKFNDVIEAVQPTADGSHITSAINVANRTMDMATIRLAYLRATNNGQTGISAGDEASVAAGWRAWGETFAQTAEQGDRGGISGYKSSTQGFAVGIDTENYIDNVILGASFSYGFTNASSNNTNETRTKVQSSQFTLYGDYTPNNRVYFNGMASMSWHDIAMKRHNVGGISGLTAMADADGSQYAFQLEAGRNYIFPTGITISPNLIGKYIYYISDDYVEKGAGGANLIVESNNLSIMELGVGVNAKWLFEQNGYGFLEPEIRTRLSYDLIGDMYKSTSKFYGGGDFFETTGSEPAQMTFNLGTGLRYYKSDYLEMIANYDYNHKEDYKAHSGSIRTIFKF